MLVPFSNLSDTSRIWIYPSSRKFYEQELPEIKDKIEGFLTNWQPEEVPVGFEIRYNRFLIIGLQHMAILETQVIDQLVSFVITLEAYHQVQLLDRMNVCFKQGAYIQYKELNEFQDLIKKRAVSRKTVVFDNLIEIKADIDDHWEIPITESWYRRFLK